MPILRMVFINRFIISAASLGVKTADTLWLQLFKKKKWKICHISLFYVILNRNIFGLKAVRQNNTITATSSWPLGNCVEGFLTTVWHFTTDGRNVSTDKGNGAELKVVLLVPAVECFELHRVEGRMWRVWQLFWKQSKKPRPFMRQFSSSSLSSFQRLLIWKERLNMIPGCSEPARESGVEPRRLEE